MAFQVVWVAKPGAYPDANVRQPVAALHEASLILCDAWTTHEALNVHTGETVWLEHDIDEAAQWVYAELQCTTDTVRRHSADYKYEVLDAGTGVVLACGIAKEPQPKPVLDCIFEHLPSTFVDWFSSVWFSTDIWQGYHADGKRLLLCVCKTRTKLFVCDVDDLTVTPVLQSVYMAPRQLSGTHVVGLNEARTCLYVLNVFTLTITAFPSPLPSTPFSAFYALDPKRGIVCVGLPDGEIWCVKIM